MKIKTILGSLAIIASGLVFATPTYATVTCPTPGSINKTADTLAGCNVTQDNSLMPTVQTIINVIIGVLGIVAVAVIVLGGVSYTTSAGDPGKTKKAKDTILYGIVGLVVALLAYAIVNFVLSSVFGGGTGAGTSVPSPSAHP